MRKIILDLAVTLDGFIEGPTGEIDWCIMDDEVGKYFQEFRASIDTVLYGRTSYQQFGNHQPDANSPQDVIDFYRDINQMKKYVFSRTLDSATGDATLIKDNIAEEVDKIKQQPGKDIWLFGGASLITTFVNLDLIDEYRLGVHPMVLAGGKPLFQNIEHRVELKFIKAVPYTSGMIALYYQRIAA
jgi:dihydrofolate reductase